MSFVHEEPNFDGRVRIVADKRRLSPSLVEKDYWVTHTLWSLLESGFEVWLKGGTSLSKGFSLVERFSEDLAPIRHSCIETTVVKGWRTQAVQGRSPGFGNLTLGQVQEHGLELGSDACGSLFSSIRDEFFVGSGLDLKIERGRVGGVPSVANGKSESKSAASTRKAYFTALASKLSVRSAEVLLDLESVDRSWRTANLRVLFVPLLARAPRFSLTARSMVGGEMLRFRVESGDPLFPSENPRTFDSRVEERFARDIAKLAPDWDVLREPEAVPVRGTLLFPDFLLRHRLDPTRSFLVEIVGFWTEEYLSRKLEALRAARIENLVLLINEARRCSEKDLPPKAFVVRFRKRVDASRVIEILERDAGFAG